MDDVVLPTPPFWLAKAIILLICVLKIIIDLTITMIEKLNFYLRQVFIVLKYKVSNCKHL
jgi:hypothetical protein